MSQQVKYIFSDLDCLYTPVPTVAHSVQYVVLDIICTQKVAEYLMNIVCCGLVCQIAFSHGSSFSF